MEINNDREKDLRFENTNEKFISSESEVEDLFIRPPAFVVQWGLTIFFIILLLLTAIAWVIQYPDIVVANGTLNSINSPKEVIAKTDGKLAKLFYNENKQVSENTILGFMESTADHNEILRLYDSLHLLQSNLLRDSAENLIKNILTGFSGLGELQSSYQLFNQSTIDFQNCISNGFYMQKKKMLETDLVFLLKMNANLYRQKNILKQDKKLSDSTLRANEILKEENIISALDLRIEKSKLLAKEMSLPQLNSLIIGNETLQHEKKKEIAELENQIKQQKNTFVQSINLFISKIDEWKRTYLLLAPISGKIAYASIIQENQNIKAGQLICYIIPEKSNYYVEAMVPQFNFGKVSINQNVLLKFTAYPYREFGSVKGKLIAINTIPSDSGYMAKIELPFGLVTNYNMRIQYRTGLSTKVEIITKNRRLLYRLFENSSRL